MTDNSEIKQALGTCANCRFFRLASAHRSDHLDPDVLRGECHRHPPKTVILNPASTVDCDTPVGLFMPMDDFRILHIWPVLNELDWCGEWAAKKRA
jgi:hypothetical protein